LGGSWVSRPFPGFLNPVIAAVYAGIIGRPVNLNPIGFLNPPAIPGRWAERESAGDLDPTVLFLSNHSDFRRRLGKILILTEYQGNVIFLAVGHADDIDGSPHINAFFLSGKIRMFGAVGEVDDTVPVTQRAGTPV
jgi:hypothetical protein